WDAARATEVLKTIEQVTFDAVRQGSPQLIVWPEAVTPWALYRDPNVRDWLESIGKRANRPVLLGTIYTTGQDPASAQWYNGAFLIDPHTGLVEPGYAKRKLVPFGEYIPLRPVFGWIEKFAPIGGDFQHGTDPTPLTVTAGGRRTAIGVLICYEDIFPNLARESTRAGAEVLTVLTNNAWFGEGGAAYQHAANSVLRAVENRRPVIRCGNGGWSGWIDEYGNVRGVLTDERDSVYFRGARTLDVTRDLRWAGKLSYYTEHGDWFLLVCVALVFGSYYTVLMLRPPSPETAKRF
ncbi:MAG TPA: apolipoprotein N-acyltransferase, partial [Lacunisphaera sp.]